MPTNKDNNVKDSSVKAQPTLVVWPFSMIMYAYLEDNYARGCGTLGGSCMRQKTMQKALNFYVKNNVKIVVVVTANNKIHARALLWENVLCNKAKEITYLDRVFYTSEKYLSLYREFAKKNNYALRDESFSRDNSLCIANINLNNITHLPYTDTFKYLDYKKKILYNNKYIDTYRDTRENRLTLNTTSNYGYFPELDKNSVREVLTGNFISKKDSVYVKQYKGRVLNNHILKFNNTYYSKHDTKNVKTISENKYCLTINVVSEAFTSNDIDKTKSHFIPRYDNYVSRSNIAIINKVKYSKHDPNVIHFEDRYYLVSQCSRCEDGVYIPKNRAIIVYDTVKLRVGDMIISDMLALTCSCKLCQNTTIKSENKDKKIHAFLDENNNPSFNKRLYLLDTCTEGVNYIKMNTGDFLYYTTENRSYIRKYNNKHYLKHLFEPIDKRQLLLFK